MQANHVHESSYLWPGVPLALASAALFGATPSLAKLLLNAHVSPVLLAGLFYLGAGLGLGAYRFLARRHAFGRVSRADRPWLALSIACGGVIAPVLLVFGLSQTNAANGSLLLNLEGVATMAIAWIVYRENVDRRLLLGAAAILCGAVLLSWQGRGISLNLGGLAIAGACLFWGLDNNFTRRIAAADPVVIAMLKGLVAGTINTALALATGAVLPPAPSVAAAAVIGVFGIGASLVLFIVALRHLGAARTGAYYSAAPFIGAILAVLLFGEAVTARLAVAGVLMAVGIWLHLTERHDHLHTHQMIEHEHGHVHDAHHQHPHDGPVTAPHVHWHKHEPLAHRHPHYPDIHHRHEHT